MKSRWKVIFLLFLIIGTVVILTRRVPYRNERGTIFGTLYSITYQSKEPLHDEIEKVLRAVDGSLSPFNDTSIISRINRGEKVKPDSMFLDVFNLSQEISAQTDGAFDITVAPLVNAWGFGFKQAITLDSAVVDSLRSFVDYRKVAYVNGSIVKQDARMMLDCSAIAKGFGSDMVARFLERKGIKNYMVEIGGEIAIKGTNDKHEDWKIGIAKPIDDSLAQNNELQTIISLTDAGVATSGNYRNFYYKDGKKFAHTIDPATGYPVQHSLLSSTVIAPTCAQADALATAFMVMGLDKALEYCKQHPQIEGYFIYSDEQGKLKTAHTPDGKHLNSKVFEDIK